MLTSLRIIGSAMLRADVRNTSYRTNFAIMESRLEWKLLLFRPYNVDSNKPTLMRSRIMNGGTEEDEREK